MVSEEEKEDARPASIWDATGVSRLVGWMVASAENRNRARQLQRTLQSKTKIKPPKVNYMPKINCIPKSEN